MKFKFLLLAVSAAVLASCSTTYKSGQTPDDVYYSPKRALEENHNRQQDEVKNVSSEDREIRMSTYDRRWRSIDTDYNYDYSYSPYRYGYDYGYYYNPYYYPCPVYTKGVAIRNPINTTPRTANLRTYSNSNTLITNQKTSGTYQVNSRKAYTNSNGSTGSFIRRVLTSAQNNSYNNNRSPDNNNRTYTPSNNNTNSNNSNNQGSKSSGSVSRPSRGN
ncbi:MAG: hypothetical protein ABIT07_00035 [Ferruginibacter sp.]